MSETNPRLIFNNVNMFPLKIRQIVTVERLVGQQKWVKESSLCCSKVYISVFSSSHFDKFDKIVKF